MPESKSKSTLSSLVRKPLVGGGFAAAPAAPVSAVADVFLKLTDNGAQIEGEATQKGFEKQIEILSYTQSFTNSGTGSAGGGAGAGKVSCGDITVMKNIDKSSPKLIQAVATGKHIDTGVLTFLSVGKTEARYYVVTLKDVLITSIAQTDQNDTARIFEKVSIHASDFKFDYTPLKANGAPGATVEFEFNCAANKAE